MNRNHAAIALLLVLGMVATVMVNYQRQRVLGDPREVEVILDHAAALMIAEELGIEPATFLEDLAAQGATALGISEVSFTDLPYRPGVTIYRGHELVRPGARPGDHLGMARRLLEAYGLFEPWYTYIIVRDPAFAAFLAEGATRRLGSDRVQARDLGGGGHAVVLRGVPTRARPDPRRPERDIRDPDLRFGFWPGDVTLARELGLTPVVVLADDPRLGPGDLEHLLGPVARLGVDIVFLAGDTTWGYGDRERLAAAARTLREGDMHPASLAPGEQPGFSCLAAAVYYQGLWLHKHRAGAPPGELATALVRHRPRGLYFIPAHFPGPVGATRERNRQALRELVAAMGRHGYRPGQGQPLPSYRLPPGLAAFLGMAVAAGVFGAVGAVAVRLGHRRPPSSALVAGAAMAAAIGYGWPGAGREALAFLAATTFPTWIVLQVLAVDGGGGERVARAGRAVLLALAVTAGTVAAAFLVRALLADTPYALGVRSFPAAWVAAALPPLTVIAVTSAGKAGPIARRELTQGDLLLGAGGLAAGALLVLGRAGPLRPVEFLAGHPALVTGLALPGAIARWQMAIGLMVAAAQGSVMNSFIDLPTPPAEVLGRTGGGLALGMALGLLGALVWRQYDKRGAVP